VRDHLEKVAHRRLAQALGMKGRRLGKTALHHHAQPISVAPVADGAVDVESLPTAVHQIPSHGQREGRGQDIPDFSGVESRIII
jgi:hypothetical protein